MSKQSIKKRFDLVGKKFENKLFKTNPPSTSGSFNHVRCLRSSLGSSPRICKNSGFLDKLLVFLAHKQKGSIKAAFLALKFLIPNRTNVHVQICIDNRTAVAYINHLGGTRSLELNSIAVKMWAWCLERNMFLSALYVPGITNKTADLLSRLKFESTEWMLSPKIFKQIVYVFRMLVLDMFASFLGPKTPWTNTPRQNPPNKNPLTKTPRTKTPQRTIFVFHFIKIFMLSQVHNLLIVQWLQV